MTPTGSHQKTPRQTRDTIAPRTHTLSASGSRKAPDRVVPIRRAIYPSTPSVAATTNHTATVVQDPPIAATSPMRIGVAASRAMVTALAGVASADGPNVESRRRPGVPGTPATPPPPAAPAPPVDLSLLHRPP